MKKIGSKKVDLSHYKANAVIVWCLDDRFYFLMEDFIRDQGYSHVDRIVGGGGAKKLAAGPEFSKEDVLNDIKIAIELHDAKHIVLTAHHECGAYRSLHQASGLSWDDFLKKELVKAADVVQEFCESENLANRQLIIKFALVTPDGVIPDFLEERKVNGMVMIS